MIIKKREVRWEKRDESARVGQALTVLSHVIVVVSIREGGGWDLSLLCSPASCRILCVRGISDVKIKILEDKWRRCVRSIRTSRDSFIRPGNFVFVRYLFLLLHRALLWLTSTAASLHRLSLSFFFLNLSASSSSSRQRGHCSIVGSGGSFVIRWPWLDIVPGLGRD